MVINRLVVIGGADVEKTPPAFAEQWPTGGFCALLVVRALTVLNDIFIFCLVIAVGRQTAVSLAISPAAVLAVGVIAYVLPFALFAWLAGWLADRFAKRTIVIGGKCAEICITVALILAVIWGAAVGPTPVGITVGFWLLLCVVSLFGLQTTLLAPSLLGTISEITPKGRLSAANGIFSIISTSSMLVGMALGSALVDISWVSPELASAQSPPTWLSTPPQSHTLNVAIGLLAVATAGFIVSLRLPKIQAADPQAALPWNALSKTLSNVRRLLACRQLAGAAAGIVFFWTIAAVVQLNVGQYAFESGATTQGEAMPLLCSLVCGIGVGSLLAGWLSREGFDTQSNVNLGLVPVGGLIMAVACAALAVSFDALFVRGIVASPGLFGVVFCLFLLGAGAGMFGVPLEAYLQEQSPPTRLGANLAVINLFVVTGTLASLIGYYVLCLPVSEGEIDHPLFSERGCFAIVAGLSFLATVAAILAAPRSSLRLLVDSIIRTICRFRISRADLMPRTGPAVIIANHISWLDGFLVVLASRRPVRMVVYGPNIRGRLLNRLAAQWRFILFEPKTKSIARALKTMRDGLRDGDVIGIFCEGGISRTGQVLGFKRGLGHILDRVEAPMVPLAIDGLWGSVFSFSEGRFFRKWPLSWTRPVTMRFGKPLPVGVTPAIARLALQEITAEAVRSRLECLGGGTAAAATAEAMHGCCLLRRQDRLVTSLAVNDPLAAFVTRDGFGRLGVASWAVDAELSGQELCDAIARYRATIWLARPGQVSALAALGADAGSGLPEVIVVPVAAAADLPALQPVLTAFTAAFGIQPVIAYAPPGCGLVAMNTPPNRGQGQERTCKPGTVGRVVNGAVVWPRAALRVAAARSPLVGHPGEGRGAFSLVVAATIPAVNGPGSRELTERFDVDDDGFLQVRLEP